MKKVVNILLITIVVVGVGFLAYGGYTYFHTKAKGAAAAEQADKVLKNRDIDVSKAESNEPTLFDKWNEKQEFKNKDFGHGDVMGKLLIPKIDGELPIVQGVNPDDLLKGVGHDVDTLLPLSGGQTVLSGHRDTVFRGVGKLELGDKFIMKLPYGDFAYELVKTQIVDANDRTIIVPHDEETLTVTTCYPFDYLGNAPNRYIMTAKPLFDMNELEAQKAAHEAYTKTKN